MQIQEKTDGLRLETKEIGRRAQQLDWQSSKTDQTLDALKADTSFLKQAVEQIRTMPSARPGQGQGKNKSFKYYNVLYTVIIKITK